MMAGLETFFHNGRGFIQGSSGLGMMFTSTALVLMLVSESALGGCKGAKPQWCMLLTVGSRRVTLL